MQLTASWFNSSWNFLAPMPHHLIPTQLIAVTISSIYDPTSQMSHNYTVPYMFSLSLVHCNLTQ